MTLFDDKQPPSGSPILHMSNEAIAAGNSQRAQDYQWEIYVLVCMVVAAFILLSIVIRFRAEIWRRILRFSATAYVKGGASGTRFGGQMARQWREAIADAKHRDSSRIDH
jgi:hypothetical protein